MAHPRCQIADHTLSRRRMLGTLAGAAGGLACGGLLQPTFAEELKKSDKQMLLMWLDGGMSQLESWDPKPGTQFGGPYRSIPTRNW